MTTIPLLSLKQAIASTAGRSLLGPKLSVLWAYATSVAARNISGHCAEVGVYRGGSAKMLAKMFPDRSIYLFDTFEGMPPTTAVDIHRAGDFADTSLKDVADFLQDCHNVVMCPGFFPSSGVNLESEGFAFVHLDADLYTTTLDALYWFYPRMSPGGVIVLDDYLWPQCPGVQLAMEEFMKDKEEDIIQYEYQAVIIKT